MMQAVVIRQDKLVVEELDIPQPGEGEVLVKTIACGICGSDLHLFQHGREMMETARNMGVEPDSLDDGLILGHEFVAEIVKYGPGCSETFSPGTRVCSVPFLLDEGVPLAIGASTKAAGAYAEYLLLTESLLIPVPDDLTTDVAALTEPLAIALHAVNQATLVQDATCVVIGCGPIGLTIIALLRRMGVEKIIGSDPSKGRRELAAKLGAHETVDPLATDLWASVPVDTSCEVFECSGRSGMIADIVNRAPIGTEIVVAGICSGEDSFLPMIAISKELTFRFVSHYKPEEFTEALQILSAADVDWGALITGHVGLSEVEGAFKELQGGDQHAKILIQPTH